MVLNEGQVQIRDLVMGRATAYKVNGFNPWSRTARTTGTGEMPASDGGWSGPEWREVAAVNFDVTIKGASAADWQAKHWALDAAFAPIRDATGDVELRWVTGGVEYLMFGRPRSLSPEIENLRTGRIHYQAAFSAPDPSIYSATEYTVNTGLPAWTGGLIVPATTPLTLNQTPTDGITTALNAGTTPAALLLRITGPVSRPSITVIGPDGAAQTLHLDTVIAAGQWIDIHTEERAVILNGSVSRLRDAYGSWPLLAPGTSTIRWRSDEYNPTARLLIRWRHRW